MLRFFRHIRQRLFFEEKVSRYFGYAVGEIVLIVVGILIAVQIGEWNEGRKEASIKQQYLNRIIRDLDSDAISVTSSKENAEFRLQFIGLLLETAKNPESVRKHPMDFLIAIGTSGGLGHGPINTSTYDELRSTGLFRLFDEKVRSELYQYFQNDERARLSKVARDLIDVEHGNLSKNILSAEQDTWVQDNIERVFAETIQNIRALTYDDMDSLVEAANRLANNQNFIDWLPEQRRRMLSTIRQHQRRLNRIDKLRDLLEAELTP